MARHYIKWVHNIEVSEVNISLTLTRNLLITSDFFGDDVDNDLRRRRSNLGYLTT